LNDASKGILTHAIAKQHSGQFLTTNRVFRTVYKQVKLNRPFLDFETEIDLQILNGLNMGRILHSNVTCGKIAVHIGGQMHRHVCAGIFERKAKFSILMSRQLSAS